MDHFQDLRSEMILTMEKVGIEIEVQHHEVGTAGQAEIDMRFDTLLSMADKLMLYKYIVKNVARRPVARRPSCRSRCSRTTDQACTCTSPCGTDGEPLFYSESGYGGLSDIGRWYVGGILAHARSILAFAAPTTNSYKRLVPGYEAPVNLVYSQRNRSAACRIPLYSKSPKAKRIEFRCPDPSCNPYLAFSAMLMAGLDGVANKIEPPAPVDEDLFELRRRSLAKIAQVPPRSTRRSSPRGRSGLPDRGESSPTTSSRHGSQYKRLNEIDAVRLRPHPWEFMLYYDI